MNASAAIWTIVPRKVCMNITWEESVFQIQNPDGVEADAGIKYS